MLQPHTEISSCRHFLYQSLRFVETRVDPQPGSSRPETSKTHAHEVPSPNVETSTTDSQVRCRKIASFLEFARAFLEAAERFCAWILADASIFHHPILVI